MSISRVAGSLNPSWHTVNDTVLDAGRALLINDPPRLYRPSRVVGL
jgi:transposase